MILSSVFAMLSEVSHAIPMTPTRPIACVLMTRGARWLG